MRDTPSMSTLNDDQRLLLQAVCDTVVPSVPHADDPDGFFARRATEVGADQALELTLEQMAPEQQAGLVQLLDALAQQGFLGMSQRSREQVFTNLSLASRDAAVGIAALVGLTIFFTYGLVDPATGQNPAFATFGFPGPVAPPPDVPKPIVPFVPEGDTTLEADVAIIGSGAGGGVIAGKLAQAGLDVVVLEMGGYFNEADFNQTELWGWQNLYWRGGPTPTADMNVSIQAGSCLGGGTTVNWTNSLRTKDWVRTQWAEEHGLTDVATEAFDRHLDEVWARIGVNDRCSELNKPQQAMQRAAERLGWSFAAVNRNTDPERYDPASAGYMGFGDQTGSKQGTLKTYLQDAFDAGARIVVGAFAERVIVEDGRAAGVEAVWTDRETGATARLTVRAPRVVVAAGALESPAVLLRTGIGGPAVGQHLRLHPCSATLGDYGEDMQAWWGAPHAGLINEFANVEDGYGFLIEGAQYTTGLGASALPWTSGAAHKEALAEFKNGATFIGLVRDHGGGQVVLDEHGQALPLYAMTDEVDLRNTARALEAQIRAHVAGGARRIWLLAEGLPTWRVGDDVEAFIALAQKVPARAGGLRLFAAHQMGTCRMGADPATSVANPDGELHDTPGVWIGDTSAFPTPSGTNPMITVMALASRTAERIQSAAVPATPAEVHA
jgi:choline dehydrogenase-like flavoprotein